MSEEKEDFTWDKGNEPEINFFGEKTEEVDVVEQVKQDDVEPEDKPKGEAEKEEVETEEDVDFFTGTEDNNPDTEEAEDEDEEEESEETGEENGDTTKPKKTRGAKIKATSTLNYLKEKGLINYELEEGEELTDELAEQIMEDDFDGRLDERVQELVDDMPSDAANFFKFIKEGGNTQQYLLKLAQQSVSSRIVENIDLEVEANQELVIREQMALEGDDQESISAQIEFLKESKKMKSFAQAKYKKWDKKNTVEKAAMVEQQKAAALSIKENRRKLKKTLTDFVKDKESVGTLKLSKKEKKELPGYMTDRTIQLEGGGTATEMQVALNAAMNDETKALMLAKLLKSDFNFDTIEEDAADKTAKEVKKNIRRQNNKPSKTGKSGSPKKKGALADFFD